MEVRRFAPADRPAVLELLASSLGWLPDDHHSAFFSWKHDDNPFGASLAWVAVEAGEVIGFRTFLRWELLVGGQPVRAVRAVDTATHPDHRGRGIFSILTRRALEELADEGVDAVFNTPNDQSRPGYLKMGWEVVGRLPVRARPRSPRSLVRMARARTAADLWSLPTEAGAAAEPALADDEALTLLVKGQPVPPGVVTRRSPAHLRWRFAGFPPLAYRVTLAGSTAADGMAIWRLRRRGAATEAAIVEVLAPGGDRALADRLARAAARESGADYAVAMEGVRPGRAGFVPLPSQGPLLTWRSVRGSRRPDLGEWRLALGDVELF